MSPLSPQPSQPADDGTWTDGQSARDEDRPFTRGIGSMVAPAADDETAPPTRPTFTARSGEPPTAAVPEPTSALDDSPERDSPERDSTVPEDADTPAPVLGPDDGPDDELATKPDIAPDAGLPPAGPTSSAMSADLMSTDGDRPDEWPLPTINGLDEPLLGDVDAIRARWERVQAGFVDDPKEAVGDAADLIEQTAQALVGSLRQRQRQLRVLWERGPADGAADGTAPVDGDSRNGADTEHLRLMMQRYRSLFNQLARP